MKSSGSAFLQPFPPLSRNFQFWPYNLNFLPGRNHVVSLVRKTNAIHNEAYSRMINGCPVRQSTCKVTDKPAAIFGNSGKISRESLGQAEWYPVNQPQEPPQPLLVLLPHDEQPDDGPANSSGEASRTPITFPEKCRSVPARG